MQARIRQWLKSKGLSYKEIAEKMGYKSPRYVEHVLRGWEKMRPAFIGRFIQAFPEAYPHIFLPDISEKTDIMSNEKDGE